MPATLKPGPVEMTEDAHPIPTEINLHKKSRVLAIRYSDGRQFELPCEYLRVFSKAKEVRMTDRPITGKEGVNIERIEPQGQYALRLVFDDGHDTGIYSFDTLYHLGLDHERNWQEYLARLKAFGYQRDDPTPGGRGSQAQVSLLYFAWLAKFLRKDHETLTLPDAVKDVSSLLGYLRMRYPDRQPYLQDVEVRVTVNKQFAEPFTRIEDGDEVALVPASPTPPAGA
jgi:DUF971 family protein/molybdopterin converting factor small subunit